MIIKFINFTHSPGHLENADNSRYTRCNSSFMRRPTLNRLDNEEVFKLYPNLNKYQGKSKISMEKMMERKHLMLMIVDITCSILNIFVVTILYIEVRIYSFSILVSSEIIIN